MSEIAIIGEKEVVWGFRVLGVSVFDVDKADELPAIIDTLVKKDVALIFITESLAEYMIDFLRQIEQEKSPTVCIIPNPKNRLNLAERRMRDRVKRAIGLDIY
jgi:V/A-type H+/Na+-transporting ATPase subunit F